MDNFWPKLSKISKNLKIFEVFDVKNSEIYIPWMCPGVYQTYWSQNVSDIQKFWKIKDWRWTGNPGVLNMLLDFKDSCSKIIIAKGYVNYKWGGYI